MPKYNLQKQSSKRNPKSFTTLKAFNILAKEELRKLKYFTMPKYNLQKNPLKRNKKSFTIL
jgi:hypothetical protein